MTMNYQTTIGSKLPALRTACGCALVFVFCVSNVHGQQQQQQQQLLQQSQQSEDRTQQRITVPSTLLVGPALEGAVNPEKYILGPSDIIAVNIFTLSPMSIDLTVTPEGSLIIPTVGEVNVGGISLKDAKKTVIAAIKRKYVGVDPTVTLIYPRQLVVKVTGDVVVPGRYVLSSTDRVDNAIQIANKAPAGSEQRLRMTIEIVEKTASTRNIRLTRKDGKAVRVDIPRFYASRDDDSNPYLLDGDEVFVPRIDGAKDAIGVYGGVNSPSRFEFARGDNVADAIQLAHGVTPRAITDSVTLTRFAEDGTTLRDTTISYDGILKGTSRDVTLRPGDRIVVREKYDPREDFRATVQGEVLYPGTYPITRDSTRISQLIKRAGGFTDYAALRDVQILRSLEKPVDLERELILSARGLTLAEDSAYLLLENKLRIMHEVIDADLDALYKRADSSQDVTLRTQDTLLVPSLRNTVYVFGQVVKPGGVRFVPGKDVDYYIAEAKGFTEFAKTGAVVVVKRTTRQWFPPADTRIEDGDYVWVPREIKHDLSYWLTILGQSASILSVALTAVLIVIQLSK